MSNRTVNVPSLYGPVHVDLTACDGPGCNNCVQNMYMVSWLSLEWIGDIAISTMGSHINERLDFCSLECLKRAVDAMTGA